MVHGRIVGAWRGLRKKSGLPVKSKVAMAGLILMGSAMPLLLLRPGELAWWVINLAGWAALLLLCASAAVPPAGLRLNLHASLGRWALGLALLHAVAIPAIDSTIWRYADVSMPGEILVGVLALILLLVVILMREPGLLLRWPAPAAWPHRLFALFAAVLALAHIVFVPGLPWWGKAGLVAGAALVLMPLLPKLRLRWPARSAVALTGLTAFLGLFLFAGPFVQARMAALREAPLDQRMFDHATHTSVACLTCHHNFADRSGFENCIPCHKAVSFDEVTRIDRTFHALCTGCHAERRLAAKAHGPTDSCLACHAKQAASTSPKG